MTDRPLWMSGSSRAEKQKNKLERRQRRAHFVVDYDLVYDGGGSQWTGYYRTYWGARFSAFLNVHIKSWGGWAELYTYPRPPKFIIKVDPPKKKGIFRGRK